MCTTAAAIDAACHDLTIAGTGAHGAIGFDTEWKPLFKKGQVNTGEDERVTRIIYNTCMYMYACM